MRGVLFDAEEGGPFQCRPGVPLNADPGVPKNAEGGSLSLPVSMVDDLYQHVRAGFGSRREFWGAIRATFRLFRFPSWDHVLVRMNSPPQPLSG